MGAVDEPRRLGTAHGGRKIPRSPSLSALILSCTFPNGPCVPETTLLLHNLRLLCALLRHD